MPETTDPQTVAGATAAVSRALISALPPAFVMLCLINVGFLAFVMWFVNQQSALRADAWKQMVDRCLIERSAGR